MHEDTFDTPVPSMLSFEHLEALSRARVQQFIQAVLDEELTAMLGRDRSQRRPAVDAPRAYRNGHGKPRHDMAAMTKGCLAGSAICFVSHTGEVFPCGYLPLSAGNVTKQHIRDIWGQSELFTKLRDPDQLEGKCGCCEFKRICLGCRARAYYADGNYMAEEPFCVYEPKKLRDENPSAS